MGSLLGHLTLDFCYVGGMLFLVFFSRVSGLLILSTVPAVFLDARHDSRLAPCSRYLCERALRPVLRVLPKMRAMPHTLGH